MYHLKKYVKIMPGQMCNLKIVPTRSLW
uniref:Uncharacterized protein n=1 Tax=Anguilla anguilla TaxID=7936 RepID=A0A0E9QQA9_ANGAN